MTALRSRAALVAFVSILGFAGPAAAERAYLEARLSIQVGTLPPVYAMGSGDGVVGVPGRPVPIPAGFFRLGTTAAINPPLLVINGFGVGAPGQLGGELPLEPGTNKALAWNGT